MVNRKIIEDLLKLISDFIELYNKHLDNNPNNQLNLNKEINDIIEKLQELIEE